MKGIKFEIDNRSKFHIGDANGNLKESFASDQLFSAIINNLALLYPQEEIEEGINIFSEGKLSISSLFYGLDFVTEGRKEKSLYFLPRPEAVIRTKEGTEAEVWQRKKIKKITYLSTAAYQELLSSWNEEEQVFNYNLLELELIGNKFACTTEELEELGLNKEQVKNLKFIKKNSRPRLSINRENSKSEEHFYQNNMEIIYQQAGKYQIQPFMFFMYQGELPKELLASFRLIAEEGIGGKRSSGMGSFSEVKDISESEFEALSPTGDYYVNLSVLFPRKDEVKQILSYDLAERRGYIYSRTQGGQPYRKKSIRVMQEGSLTNDRIQGQLVDVTPELFDRHEVLVNGTSFLIGFGGEQ
ncbi:MAG: type III-A CRISPR-associated RAMP protein Csm4 [Bacillota bacterium]